MTGNPTTPQTIDAYIAAFPEDIQAILQKIRLTIRQSAPEAEEAIKYGIPTFTLKGNLISFAAYKKHIGLYPTPAGTEEFQQALSAYKREKSTLQFPLDKPIPYDLIGKTVKFRLQEHLARLEAKGKK